MNIFKKSILAIALLAGLITSAAALEPVVHDLVIQAGEDFHRGLQMNSCADNPAPIPPQVCQNWVPSDLRGYSYKAQFRSAPAPAGTLFANFSCIFTNQSVGRFDIKLSAAQTTTNSGRSGVWDLQQTDSAGQISYAIRGKAAVSPTVTR